MSDLHVPATDPNQALIQRIIDLERKVENQGVTLGIAGAEPARMKVIRGTINTAGSGSIVSGTGFTISRPGVGAIVTTWTVPFSAAPTCVATAVDNTVNWLAVGLPSGTQPTATSARFQLITFASAAADSTFHFVAVGPA